MVPFATRVRALTAGAGGLAHTVAGRLSALDRALLGSLVALCGWVVITTALGRAPAWATLAYVLSATMLGLGLVLGRAATRDVSPTLLLWPMGGLTGIIVLGVLATGGALSAPLGYSNANAALAVQVIALVGLAALRFPADLGLPGLICAGFAYAGVITNRSLAGSLLGGAVLVAFLALRIRPARRPGPALLLGSGVVLGAVVAAFSLARSTAWPAIVEAALSARRRELWNEALGLLTTNPVTGHGTGSFRLLSSAAQDPDTQAAHSVLLQVGAEAGLVGLAILAAIAGVGFLVLGRGRADLAVLGAAAWTALWTHAQVDYIYAFPSVILVAGAVLGFASAPPAGSEQLDVPQGEHPLGGLGR